MSDQIVHEDDDGAVPGYRTYLIYTDESGMHGSRYYGFGSLWMPNERRGTFHALVSDLRQRHRLQDEIKWTKVNRRSKQLCLDLIEQFFRARWLMFHCFLVREGYVDKSFHGGSIDLARRKHFDTLISTKIAHFSKGFSDKAYHLRLDPFHTSYEKFPEAAQKIIASTVKKRIGSPCLQSVIERNSKTTPGIQLADLLLGAVMADWDGEASAEPKMAVKKAVAQHLGWPDLRADSFVGEWKFNIWCFYAPNFPGPREAATRQVRLKYPMPPLRRPNQPAHHAKK